MISCQIIKLKLAKKILTISREGRISKIKGLDVKQTSSLRGLRELVDLQRDITPVTSQKSQYQARESQFPSEVQSSLSQT